MYRLCFIEAIWLKGRKWDLKSIPYSAHQAKSPNIKGSTQSIGDSCLIIPRMNDFYELSIHRKYLFIIYAKGPHVLLEYMGKRINSHMQSYNLW